MKKLVPLILLLSLTLIGCGGSDTAPATDAVADDYVQHIDQDVEVTGIGPTYIPTESAPVEGVGGEPTTPAEPATTNTDILSPYTVTYVTELKKEIPVLLYKDNASAVITSPGVDWYTITSGKDAASAYSWVFKDNMMAALEDTFAVQWDPSFYVYWGKKEAGWFTYIAHAVDVEGEQDYTDFIKQVKNIYGLSLTQELMDTCVRTLDSYIKENNISDYDECRIRYEWGSGTYYLLIKRNAFQEYEIMLYLHEGDAP